MFKNTTRRGLAIGAAISLALTGLVSAPAQAAGEVVLQPSAGTTYSTLVTETFKLQASLGAGQPAGNIAQLKYKIDKANTVPLTVGAAAVATPSTTSHNAASTSFVVVPSSVSSSVPNFITVAVTGASAATASADVVVTAWIDSTPNDVIDAGEFFVTQTVSFKKYSDVTANIAITQPLEGDTAVAGTAVLAGINMSQVQGTLQAKVSVAGTATNSVNVTVADGKFSAAHSALAAAATVSADAVIGTDKIGASSATLTVTAKSVKDITNSPVVGANLKSTGAAAADARINSAFQVKAKASSTTSAFAAVVGAKVTVQVTTSQTLTSTISLTVNGTTYTDGTKLPTLELTTDANGEATVSITPAGFAAEETITLITKSENNTAANYVVTQKTAAYSLTNDGGIYAKTTLGGTVNLSYTVKDQFDVVLPRADRVKVTYNGSDKYATLSAGKATVAVTAVTASGTATVSATVETQNASTLNWGDATDVTDNGNVALTATDVADIFDGTAPLATATKAISRVDAEGDLTNVISFSGSVNNAGATVVVSAAGVKFAKTADGAVVNDSITITTGTSGNFEVYVYTHIAGDVTITYTTGVDSKTTKLTTNAAAYNEGKVLTIATNDANGFVAPGSTVRGSVKLVDEYGNPVAVTNNTASFAVVVTGPGFVSSLPTSTGSTGETAVFSVLLGSADAGDLVITATYDADGTATASAAVTVTKTLTVGSPAASVVEQKLTVGSFKGFVAIYTKGYTGSKLSAKVAGKWLTVSNLSSFTRTVRLTGAGYTIKVDLYIDGKFVRSETVVTK